MIRSRLVLAGGALPALLFAGTACAQNYPCRPVRVLLTAPNAALHSLTPNVSRS